ncbi:hypothetical protein FJU11_12255 [Pararhizobium mangrovi]|uniref:Uncharacterized protein n=2 Tax=Pararhizobium mangrovi TaxID=2590452 RepID=A0A506U1D8_9HYPH|nr:hypothetical protein FJU11_12255 [Pararhizobium mangrovi]
MAAIITIRLSDVNSCGQTDVDELEVAMDARIPRPRRNHMALRFDALFTGLAQARAERAELKRIIDGGRSDLLDDIAITETEARDLLARSSPLSVLYHWLKRRETVVPASSALLDALVETHRRGKPDR